MPSVLPCWNPCCPRFAAAVGPQLATCSRQRLREISTLFRAFNTTIRPHHDRDSVSPRFVRMEAVKGGKKPLFSLTLSPTDSDSQYDDVSAISHIFDPIHEGDTDLVLVFCPGAFQASENYFPLMHMIQSELKLRLWIAVMHNTDHGVLNTLTVDASLTGLLAILKERGYCPGSIESENVFIAGHSMGAWVSRAVAVRRATAFIQIGCNFDPEADSLIQYPRPVLTVSGGLDGQLTPATLAKHAGEVAGTEQYLGRYNTYAVKPVIFIAGMNHAQVSDGRVNWERGDLQATISIDDARHRVAEFVAAFLAVQAKGPNEAVGAHGLGILTKGVNDTHSEYRALWESLANQAGDAVAHLLHIAPLPALRPDNITSIHHHFLDNFVISKPWIDTDMNQVFITTYLFPAGKRGICNLWIKMKSREALLPHFGAGDDPGSQYDPATIQTLGKEINSKTFDAALALVSTDARDKFMKMGKKLRFVDDSIMPKAELWVESDLSFTSTSSGDIEVGTPIIYTPTNIYPRYAGMHYMKLLTIARAIHWILIDSFR